MTKKTELTKAEPMKFFHFSQNNSGGSFDFDRERGITHHVVVEARDADHANQRAEDIGLYFGGAGDCPCCGDRWYEQWCDDGNDQPMVYDEPVSEFKGHRWMGNDPEGVVHYLDGRVEWFGFPEVKALPAPEQVKPDRKIKSRKEPVVSAKLG